ncbi:MAG: FHA domain-containing protein [Candidatus Dormibacteria bacterium]
MEGPALLINDELHPVWRMTTTIGRFDPLSGSAPDVDLTDADGGRRVSRRHAEIASRDGIMHLRDLGSTNGTCLNGRRLEAFRYVHLAEGDTLEFGNTRASFLTGAAWPAGLVAEWDARTLTGSMSIAPDSMTRCLGTLMFSDLVGSTEQAVRIGGSAWLALLHDYYTVARRCITRHRGQESGRTGDGILATFGSPEDALRCAAELREQVRQLGQEVHTGVHYGEYEALDGELSGATVHATSRVCTRAVAGEILVTRTIVELTAGSGLIFADRGAQRLKGLPGRWRLYSLTSAVHGSEEDAALTVSDDVQLG